MDLADKITARAGPSLKALSPVEHTLESGDKYTGARFFPSRTP